MEPRDPGAQKTTPKLWVLGAGCGFRPTHHARSPTRSLDKPPGSCAWGRKGLWRHLVDTCSNSNTQVFLPSLAQLTPGLIWPWVRCWQDFLPTPTPACFPTQEVPCQVGYFSLKGFQSPEANVPPGPLVPTPS